GSERLGLAQNDRIESRGPRMKHGFRPSPGSHTASPGSSSDAWPSRVLSAFRPRFLRDSCSLKSADRILSPSPDRSNEAPAMFRNLPRNRKPRRGVTLVEMLVTVALLVLMMTIIVSIFSAATGAMSGAKVYQELDGSLRQID